MPSSPARWTMHRSICCRAAPMPACGLPRVATARRPFWRPWMVALALTVSDGVVSGLRPVPPEAGGRQAGSEIGGSGGERRAAFRRDRFRSAGDWRQHRAWRSGARRRQPDRHRRRSARQRRHEPGQPDARRLDRAAAGIAEPARGRDPPDRAARSPNRAPELAGLARWMAELVH